MAAKSITKCRYRNCEQKRKNCKTLYCAEHMEIVQKKRNIVNAYKSQLKKKSIEDLTFSIEQVLDIICNLEAYRKAYEDDFDGSEWRSYTIAVEKAMDIYRKLLVTKKEVFSNADITQIPKITLGIHPLDLDKLKALKEVKKEEKK